MNIRIFSLILLFINMGIFCAAAQSSREIAIAKQVDSVYKSIRNIKYRFKAKKLYFMDKDTVFFEGECRWARRDNDSLGYWANIHQSTNSRVIYNGEQIIWIDENDRQISISDVKQDGYTNFTGNTISLIIPSILNNKNFLQSFEQSFINEKVLKSEVIEGENSIDFTTYYKPADIIKNIRFTMSLDKKTLLPVHYISYAEMGEYVQYNDYSFEQITLLNEDSSCFFLNTQQQKDYKITIRKKTAPEELISVGKQSPSWELTDLDQQLLNSDSLKGKILILDFWYMSCYPCLKMHPVLNEIDSLYKDKDVKILGMNVYDRDKQRVLDFAKTRINYDVLLNASPVAQKFQVSAYPTLYIIDRNGRIVYADSGYSDEIADKIKSIINKLE